MADSPSSNKRSRQWLFVVYPDSAPDDWRDVIDSNLCRWVESPLHQFDVNPNGEGEIKKAHWHIMLDFDSLKSFRQVQEITESINATIPLLCNSPRGAVRYMAHLDNPDKFQYPVSEIVCHCGADLADYIYPSRSDRYGYISEMIEYCEDHNILEFADLVNYARLYRKDDWFPLLCDNSAIVMCSYLKSARGKRSTLLGPKPTMSQYDSSSS